MPASLSMPADLATYRPDTLFDMLDAALATARTAGADEAEIAVSLEQQGMTRFATSAIHQNLVRRAVTVAVRAVVAAPGGGVGIGRAIAGNLDSAVLAQTAQTAVSIARVQANIAPNTAFGGLPAPGTANGISYAAYRDATARATADERATTVAGIVAEAATAGFVATGSLQTTIRWQAVANTRGIRVAAPVTTSALKLVVLSEDGGQTGFAEALNRDYAALTGNEIARATRRAIATCARNRDRIDLPPGNYDVILEEVAVADLLRFLALHTFNAQAYQDGRSYFVGRLGQPVMGANVSLWDDPTDPATLNLPFDAEGVTTQRVPLVTGGVAAGVVYDSHTAYKDGRTSDGHGLAVDFPAPDVRPFSGTLFMQPGDTPRDVLTAGDGIERGILVTRFHYTHAPDPKRVVATGTTRDGTFLIENGRISRAISDMRFTQSVIDAFGTIRRSSRETELHRDWWSDAAHHVPVLHIADFAFTGSAQG